jgi:hypothetical protein
MPNFIKAKCKIMITRVWEGGRYLSKNTKFSQIERINSDLLCDIVTIAKNTAWYT